MKTLALALVLSLAAACSVSHRSGEFACTQTSQCDTGRICEGGFCVAATSGPDGSIATDGGGSGSGSGMHPDAGSTCPSICNTCDLTAKTCDITCAGGECNGKVTCPTGYSCTIACNALGSCEEGIDCTESTGCTIMCGARKSCAMVECGQGPCEVTCQGMNSCEQVDCSNSCKCDVNCTGQDVCQGMTAGGGIMCPKDGLCTGANGGCSSTQDPICDSCN